MNKKYFFAGLIISFIILQLADAALSSFLEERQTEAVKKAQCAEVGRTTENSYIQPRL